MRQIERLIIGLMLFTSISGFSQKNMWIEPEVGLSFVQDDLARIYGDFDPRQDISNSVKFSLRPKLFYQWNERFWLGGHLGYAFEFASLENQSDIELSNYKIGLQARYDIMRIITGFQLYTEIGGNYNLLTASNNTDESYAKLYTDLGLKFNFSEKLYAALIFKDIVSYHSNDINFRNREDLEIANPFKEFIEFPFFAVGFRLD